jgi:DNA-binding NarL/FixJ family response regulator
VSLHLVVADDDPDYRRLVALALEGQADLEIVGEAATAAELADQVGPDVDLVLLDASMPGAVEAVPALQEAHPSVRFVVVSSLPAGHVADAVARVRAVGSLAKDIPLSRLPDAIKDLGALVDAVELALHSEERTLPGVPASARTSRQVLAAALDGWCDAEVQDAAALMISELVTNGIRHAGSDVRVRIAVGARTVRVEIGDQSPDVPVMRTPQPTDIGGRGMRIVDELSLRWGIEARRTGKSVWFELPRRPGALPA